MARITFSSSEVLMLPLPSLVFIQNFHFVNKKYFNRPPHSLHSFLPNPCPDMAFYEAANDNVSPLSNISTPLTQNSFSHFHNKMKTKAWPCQTHWKLLAILHFAWVQDPCLFSVCTWSLYLEVNCRQLRCQIRGCFQNRGCSRDRFLVLTDLPRSALVAFRRDSQARRIRRRENLFMAMNLYTMYICH